MPDIKEKLVELIDDYTDQVSLEDFRKVEFSEDMADHLIASGVTIQEHDGCEYCKADSDGFRKMFGAFSLVNPFHGRGWQIHAGKCKPREIYYCPMCGRKLSEPPKGGTEG